MPTIEDKVKAIIADHLACDEGEITPGTHISEDLDADSLDQVELTMLLEEKFDISISDEEAETAMVFKDIVELVEKKATMLA